MILFDYKNAIHPDSGKTYEVYKDIIITPFWTEEFCNHLVLAAEMYQDRFQNTIQGPGSYAWKDMALNHISDVTFFYYCRQYKKDLIPILHEVYGKTIEIEGWFTPQLLRYDTAGQHVIEHYDVSLITVNVKLNNNYDGCDLIFPRQNFSCKDIPPGHAIVWPSAITHPHYSTPLVSGKKYAMSSWTWPPRWSPGDAGSIVNSDQL